MFGINYRINFTFVIPVELCIYIHIYVLQKIYEYIYTLIRENLSVCHVNKLPLSGGEFFPLQSSRTTASLPYTFNVHCTFGGYALEAQIRRYAANPTSTSSRPSGSAGLTDPSICIYIYVLR